MKKFEKLSKRELIAELMRERARSRLAATHESLVAQEELATQNDHLRELKVSLEQSRDRYAQLFEEAPIPYVEIDLRGFVVDANRLAQQVVRMRKALVVGRPFFLFVARHDVTRFLEHVSVVAKTEPMASIDLALRSHRSDGETPFHLESRRSSDGSIRIVLFDRSEQLRVDAEKNRADSERVAFERREAAAKAATDERDRFLAMLSHELRTPLVPILVSLSSLEMRRDLSPELSSQVGLMRRNLDAEIRLVDDLLDVTRLRHGKLRIERTVVDLHELAREVAAQRPELTAHHRRAVELALNAPRHHVNADRLRLQQVLWNLIGNARRVTPANGTITLTTENGPGGELRLRVRDTGVGIEPDLLPRLFLPFSQTDRPANAGRLGLGLALCRGLMEAHGGAITASSEGPGRGATFEIVFPASAVVDPKDVPAKAPRAPAAPPPPHEDESAQRATRRVLLVEDHVDSATALSRWLRAQSFQVEVAASIAEALRKAEPRPDVLLCDLDLPDGSGFELLAMLGGEDAPPALALSGHSGPERAQRSREAGFLEHLVKPVDVKLLLAAIDRAIAARASTPSRRHRCSAATA